MNQENQSPKPHSHTALLSFAIVGWLGFIGIAFYGIFYYGPQKFADGAASGADPLMGTDAFIQESPNLDPDGEVIPDSTIGTIVRLTPQQIVISFEDARTGDISEEAYTTNQETIYIRRTVTTETTINEEGYEETVGTVSDFNINRSNLRVGDEVEVKYTSENSQNVVQEVVKN